MEPEAAYVRPMNEERKNEGEAVWRRHRLLPPTTPVTRHVWVALALANVVVVLWGLRSYTEPTADVILALLLVVWTVILVAEWRVLWATQPRLP